MVCVVKSQLSEPVHALLWCDAVPVFALFRAPGNLERFPFASSGGDMIPLLRPRKFPEIPCLVHFRDQLLAIVLLLAVFFSASSPDIPSVPGMLRIPL